MIKTIYSRVMWVGRTTVFTVGLAVTLALLLGVATAALAAVPGDPFKLGQLNSTNRISQLVGSTTSAMLRIDNNGTGSALQLLVEPNRPPLTVNATAGKASNLNADKLDGNTADDFYYYGEKVQDSARADFAEDSGHADYAERANDSALLNGKNSTAFFSGITYYVWDIRLGNGEGSTPSAVVRCDQGDKVLGGGGSTGSRVEDTLVANEPLIGPGGPEQGWEAQMRDGGYPSQIRVNAVCADFPPYRP